MAILCTLLLQSNLDSRRYMTICEELTASYQRCVMTDDCPDFGPGFVRAVVEKVAPHYLKALRNRILGPDSQRFSIEETLSTYGLFMPESEILQLLGQRQAGSKPLPVVFEVVVVFWLGW